MKDEINKGAKYVRLLVQWNRKECLKVWKKLKKKQSVGFWFFANKEDFTIDIKRIRGWGRDLEEGNTTSCIIVGILVIRSYKVRRRLRCRIDIQIRSVHRIGLGQGAAHWEIGAKIIRQQMNYLERCGENGAEKIRGENY